MKIKLIRVWLLFAWLGAPGIVGAQSPDHRAAEIALVAKAQVISQPPFVFGGALVLEVEARHAPGGIALLPEPLSLFKHLVERTQVRTHERRQEGEVEIDRYRLELIALAAGPLEIPAIPLALGSTTAHTEAITILVETGFNESELPVATSTLAAAMPELEGMAAADPPPEKVVISDYMLAWIMGGTILLLGGLFLLWRWLRKRKKGTDRREVALPPRPAHEIALERLRQLGEALPSQASGLKPFFSELSEILRAYSGARYKFDSLDLTLAELMDVLCIKSTPGLDQTMLQGILELSDQVKFAKLVPDLREAKEALATALDIIRSSKEETPA